MSALDPTSEKDIYELENKLWKEGFIRVMGLDEVGRGCLAGPVVAAGVILDPAKQHHILRISDSKKLRASERVEIAKQIQEQAIFWTVASCEPAEIDKRNILKASLLAMSKCVGQTTPEPDFLLIDGNKGIEGMLLRSQTVVKGDDRSATIGAASILAKVHRDELMRRLHSDYPEFGWDQNVGYPTVKHYEALENYGYTPHHRTSFRLRTSQPYKRQ